ncbi:MAG TPA: VOC family protein [Stackebrandtia sp.]|jgi:catechol 2,3-dioxygenase-like lactoylglutathione lyase family enzyme|uniref:VOC family protein n=1 Tax=Stackebrandtia sp. TaxID=2023065 RepID=UPI002D727AE0|nr:VOC family protein [Stackebrandtia sp.]HZE39162.1 VOC family protein [Stackebrandtia sp.]
MAALTPPYHIALVVEDLDAAMADLGRTIGLEWNAPFVGGGHLEMDGQVVEGAPRVVFSRQGPPYLELVERVPGTVWAETGLHHIGLWTDDIAAESANLEDRGAPLEAHGARGDGQRTFFCYHQTASGMRVELVDIGRSGPHLARYLS